MPKPNIGQGDTGKTHLAFGSKESEKVSKNDLRVEVVGQLDELISLIGVARTHNRRKALDTLLAMIQDHLFRMQPLIAILPDRESHPALPRVDEELVAFLEETIVKYERGLPKLQNFIYPGSTKDTLEAFLHLARAKTRTIERVLVGMPKKYPAPPNAQAYINRLSDVFFTLARWVNHKKRKKEDTWIGKNRRGI